MVPRDLTSANEIYNFARNAYKQMMGFFPDGIDNIFLKRGAAEMQNLRDKTKVVQFPGGGKDKISPFKERPGEGELSVTIEGETKNMTPEGIMDVLMGKGKAKDVNIGTAPKTKKTKPAVDPELQKSENLKKEFEDFSTRNMTGVEAMKEASSVIGRKGKYKNISEDDAKKLLEKLDERIKGDMGPMQSGDDPDLFADGGRIGFGSGGITGAGFAGNQTERSQPQEQGPMGPVFETNDPGAAAKEVMARMAGSGLTNIPMGGGFGLDFGLGARRSIDAGISFNPQNPNFDLQLGVGALQGKPVIGAQFRKQFKDGSKPKDPSRRTFLKGMAGLASIPFIGKFFKPAAKVVEKAAPVVQEGAKLGFENFMLLVDKIKRLGKSADNQATKEREKVIRYEGKDGSEYELVEDLTTGDISVTRDKPGVAVYGRGTDDVEGIDVIEDRSTFIYRKGEDVVDTKTGKSKRSPDEYEELQQTSGDGEGFDGIDEIDDKIVNDVINELTDVAPIDDLTANQYMGTKNLRSKKAGGGLAYMLGE